jgi:hypothetical protein
MPDQPAMPLADLAADEDGSMFRVSVPCTIVPMALLSGRLLMSSARIATRSACFPGGQRPGHSGQADRPRSLRGGEFQHVAVRDERRRGRVPRYRRRVACIRWVSRTQRICVNISLERVIPTSTLRAGPHPEVERLLDRRHVVG